MKYSANLKFHSIFPHHTCIYIYNNENRFYNNYMLYTAISLLFYLDEYYIIYYY